MPVSPELSPQLVERVLSTLGFSYAPTTDLAGLRALYAAWCRKVPFDNLRKRIHLHRGATGPLPGGTAEDFFDAWLKHRTGGTCWAGNGALCALLLALGFPARRGIATMRADLDIPPNHGTVLVDLEGSLYVVDASILHSEPLVLKEREPSAVDHPAWGVSCANRQGYWHIRWRPLHAPVGIDCRIDRLAATAEEFRERYEHTRGWSPFNFELNVRLLRGESVIGLALGQRVELDAGGGLRQRQLSSEERKRVLIDELGFGEDIVDQLPPDTATPPPPDSRAAQAAVTQ
jgi:N-hydroxyarylamine O-acetyltransferase